MRKALFLSAALFAACSSAPAIDDVPEPIPTVDGLDPKWKKPPPRNDGAPITLRAAKVGNSVQLFGYGMVEGAKGVAIKVRFLDDHDVILAETSVATPCTPVAGKWYRITSVSPWGDEAAKFTKVVARVREVIGSDLRSKTWEEDFRWGGFYSWTRTFPKKVPDAEKVYPIVVTKLGIDHFGKSKVFPERYVMDYGVYNASDKKWKRVDMTMEGTDAAGAIGKITGSWVELGGTHEIPFLEPKAWGPAHFVAEKDVERWQKATSLKITIDYIEGENRAELYRAPKK